MKHYIMTSKLDEIQHNHSLVIIKNTFEEDIDNYLVYFDERWECKLFLNYKTQVYNDEQNIINNVSSDLRINPELIHCNYIAAKIQKNIHILIKKIEYIITDYMK